MTSKELKRLSRSDLLEMLLELSRENDALRKENLNMRQQLNDRTIAIENCGSLAEAALQLNGIFEAAQAACEQYTQNIRSRSENLEQYCQQMEQQTLQRCDEMLDKAREEVRNCLENAKQERSQKDDTYAWLTELMDDGEVS
ncbi:MAG: hypothetical protein IKB09_08510 [Oscillospiraceae bacterium]|nr:hypothetical protein [Oscillospiraceae bacterium]